MPLVPGSVQGVLLREESTAEQRKSNIRYGINSVCRACILKKCDIMNLVESKAVSAGGKKRGSDCIRVVFAEGKSGRKQK